MYPLIAMTWWLKLSLDRQSITALSKYIRAGSFGSLIFTVWLANSLFWIQLFGNEFLSNLANPPLRSINNRTQTARHREVANRVPKVRVVYDPRFPNMELGAVNYCSGVTGTYTPTLSLPGRHSCNCNRQLIAERAYLGIRGQSYNRQSIPYRSSLTDPGNRDK
ncbi:unnamed protein product [Medioppia subpectinata]|uniref:Uncharacterized protein n=1 Tax=Medioppia subpectinata TaxID=1979941 RepID=A0A7R9PWY3_9ACAR|nr:unnamed protein product [Medioppia subpectinata]CAG2103403.1 unnamed protein product [Medioppia subpectinata]